MQTHNSTVQHFPKISEMVIHVYDAYDINIDVKDGGYFCQCVYVLVLRRTESMAYKQGAYM